MLILSFLFILTSSFAYSDDLHIIGDDSRIQILDSKESYYRSVGYVTSGCSGTLISKRHVLTAAHCIYNNKTKNFEHGHGFIPGATTKNEYPFGAYNWKKVMLLDEYVKNDKNVRSLDYAVIELDQDVESYDPELIKFMNVQDFVDEEFSSVSINGYPGDKKSNTLWKDECSSSNRIEDNLSYLCDSTKGMSGSGILYHSGEMTNILLAVNSGGRTVIDRFGDQTIFNMGVKINKEVYDQVMKWVRGSYEDETYVLESTINSFNFIIKSNCEKGLKIYASEQESGNLVLDEYNIVMPDTPYTFKSSTKDVYIRGEIVGNSRSFFGSYEYFLSIDEVKKPAYKVSIDSGLFSDMGYTLNCN